MIEVLVVCVLLLTALALVSGFLLSSWSGGKQAVGKGDAQVASNELLSQLRADVSQALGPDRMSSAVTDPKLRDFVLSGSPIGMRDVVVATATTLWVVSDAVVEPAGTNPVNECVGYIDSNAGLERQVRVWSSGCTSGTLIESTNIAPRNGAPSSSMDGPRFRYVLEQNPSLGTGEADIDNCVTKRNVASVTGSRLSNIVAVQVNASAFSNGGEQEFTPESSYSIASRRAYAYRKALGCAQ